MNVAYDIERFCCFCTYSISIIYNIKCGYCRECAGADLYIELLKSCSTHKTNFLRLRANVEYKFRWFPHNEWVQSVTWGTSAILKGPPKDPPLRGGALTPKIPGLPLSFDPEEFFKEGNLYVPIFQTPPRFSPTSIKLSSRFLSMEIFYTRPQPWTWPVTNLLL